METKFIDGNKKIATFLNGKLLPFNMPNGVVMTWQGGEFEKMNGNDEHLLWFHTSYEWIMAAIDKIETMECCRFHTILNSKDECFLILEKDIKRAESYWGSGVDESDTKVLALWEAVVEFIDWYNNE